MIGAAAPDTSVASWIADIPIRHATTGRIAPESEHPSEMSSLGGVR
jgi:hypothetical protein